MGPSVRQAGDVGRALERLLERVLAVVPVWVLSSLPELAALERQGLHHPGRSLVHFDLRHDNHLVTPDGLQVVDRGRATLGEPWLDVVCLLLESDLAGDRRALFRSHPLSQNATQQDVAAVLAVLASYWVRVAATPGDPVIRRRQARSRDWTLDWLERELAWSGRAPTLRAAGGPRPSG